jgi:hypothetical protein
VGAATIDRVAVGKATDVEDCGSVMPKTEENTRFAGADNEAREFARDGVPIGGEHGARAQAWPYAHGRILHSTGSTHSRLFLFYWSYIDLYTP